jgi:crotonobetainyl-CoA:carnitine CoA-transferase CaiB-like acyl-CoA transferase
MGQHLSYAAQSNEPVPPMPDRVSAWAVYDLFDLADGRQIFVGITSDAHWERFCKAVARPDLLADAGLATNNQRIVARPLLMPRLREIFAALGLEAAIALCERAQIPFSPIARPEDLFDDVHLNASGALLTTHLPGGIETRLPNLPLRIGGRSAELRADPPLMGQQTRHVLERMGYKPDQIEAMLAAGAAATSVIADK